MDSKRVAAIIPARMASSRFPGKPLAEIMGLPMIEHVRRRVCLSGAVDDVYVAACDSEVKEVVRDYGGKVIMTAVTHQRCTDRVNEAAAKIEADIIVIIQGDEPLLNPVVIDSLVKPMTAGRNIKCANLLSVIEEEKDLQSTDVVKAVLNNQSYLMYYSRSPMPYFQIKHNCPAYRQTGLSVFTKEFLRTFSNLPQTDKEIAESVDFLRILDYGYPVLGVVYKQRTIGVDRKSDVEEIEKILQNDSVQRALYQKIIKTKN